jgi:hypothetical protein
MKQFLLLQTYVIFFIIILASSSSFESDYSRDRDSTITTSLNDKIFILPKEVLKIFDKFDMNKMLSKVKKANEMKRMFDRMKKVVKDLKDFHVSSSRLR